MHLPLTPAAANRRGIIAMSVAMAFFIVNDTLVKFVSQSLPAAQLIFLRGLFATLLMLGICAATGALRRGPDGALPLRQLLRRPVLLRATLDAAASMVYLTALFHLPLANATAINMATPLFIALFASLALREQVGASRWAAIAIGFGGVMMIVQPVAQGFNAWALLALGGTVLHAGRDLATRLIPQSMPTLLITLSTAVAVMLLSGVMSLFEGWKPFSAGQLGLLATASVFLCAGYYLLILSMRAGEMSLIAPFRYSGLLFALALGWLVWRDVPNLLAFCGIALLVAAGLYMLHSERPRQRAAALDAASD
ncbi:MAG: DMT family transporter [Ramlibacter sp.]|nr:DMT family transporter [Ramlibacter sp.]